MIVSIEGNIGSGKSTLMKRLALGGLPLAIELEPVEEWMRPVLPCGGHMLGEFYKDPSQNALAFQMSVLLSRVKQYRRISAACHPVTVIERSLETDNAIFARPLLKGGRSDAPTWWLSYAQWMEDVKEAPFYVPTDLVVYLRCDPHRCLERVQGRDRDGETEIDIEYISKIHDLHEQWIGEMSSLVDHGSRPIIMCLNANAEGPEEIDRLADIIITAIKGLLPK